MNGTTPIAGQEGKPLITYIVRDSGDVVNGTAMLTLSRGGTARQGEVLQIPKNDALRIAKAIVDYYSERKAICPQPTNG